MDASKNSMAPWEMMLEAKDALGMAALGRIFWIGAKGLYKQMRNPEYAGDSRRPVIQRVRTLVHDLHQAGAGDLSRAILNYMAEGMGMHCVSNAQGTPDKDTMDGECIDDYPPLTRLHEAIQRKADIREVEALAEEVKREVDETVVMYRSLEEE